MSVTERDRLRGILAPVERSPRDDLTALLDDRTRQILEHRRQTPGIRRRGWLVRRMLAVADVFGLAVAFLLAEWIIGTHRAYVGHISLEVEILVFVLTLPGWIVVAKIYGLYDRDEEQTDRSTADDVVGVFHMVTVGAWLVFAAAWATKAAHPDFPKLALFWILAITLVSVGRAGARAFCRRQLSYLQNTVIVGAGDVGQTIARKFLHHPEYGINLVGFVDAEPKERREDLDDLTILGSPSDLRAIVQMLDVDRVVIAFSNESDAETLDLIRSLKDLDVQIDIVPRLFDIVGTGMALHSVEGLPLLGIPPFRLSRSSRLLKRSIDVAAAAVGLIFLVPVFAMVAAAIKLDSRGPVFFRQVRMGESNRRFRIWKFRTMCVDAEERKPELAHLNKHAQNGGDPRMFKIPVDPRMTRIGAFLRRYSIDELPQLINVLRRDMSLVGPRALILDEDQHVRGWARERLSLRPGITGPWQVLGRSGIPFEEMVRLDYLYVTGWSLFGDFKLILQTLPRIVRDRHAAW